MGREGNNGTIGETSTLAEGRRSYEPSVIAAVDILEAPTRRYKRRKNCAEYKQDDR